MPRIRVCPAVDLPRAAPADACPQRSCPAHDPLERASVRPRGQERGEEEESRRGSWTPPVPEATQTARTRRGRPDATQETGARVLHLTRRSQALLFLPTRSCLRLPSPSSITLPWKRPAGVQHFAAYSPRPLAHTGRAGLCYLPFPREESPVGLFARDASVGA